MRLLVLIDDEREASGPFVVSLRLYKRIKKLGNFDLKFIVSGSKICHEILINEGFDSVFLNYGVTYARENIKGLINNYSSLYKSKSIEISKVISSFNPDVIHVTVHPLSNMVFEITRKLNIPILIGFHSTHKKPLFKLYRLAYRKVLDSKRVVALCVSNWIKSNVESLKSSGKSKVVTLYNGIEINKNLDFPVKNSDKLEIVYAAQIRKEKGLHIFLEVCEQIFLRYNQKKDIIINIYGHGFDLNYNELIDTQIKVLNSKYKGLNIINNGYTKNILKKINSADLMIVPSIFPDPLPTVIMEAESLGIPVVGFNRGGIPELLDYDENFLVNSNSVYEMADKSVKILDSHKEIIFRKKSKEISEKYFDIKKTTENFTEIVKTLIEENEK
jgi:glycosyltransferase involved in cell wall biosynthesis